MSLQLRRICQAATLFFLAANMGGGAPQSPFHSARPYLVSISVASLDDTIAWYQGNLGFAIVKKMELPAYSLRIAFLQLNGFQLELIEFSNSVSYETIQKQFPGVDDRAKIQGPGKIAFAVDDIEAAAASLKDRKVRFFRQVQSDKETGQRSFIVADNSGNWVQFFETPKGGRP